MEKQYDFILVHVLLVPVLILSAWNVGVSSVLPVGGVLYWQALLGSLLLFAVVRSARAFACFLTKISGEGIE